MERAGVGASSVRCGKYRHLGQHLCSRVLPRRLTGHTLGQAARQARDPIRENPADPTWPAYTLYADLTATVNTTSRPNK